MKKVYLIALGGIFLASSAGAQVSKDLTNTRKNAQISAEKGQMATAKGGDDYLYYEDFAGGIPDDWTIESTADSPCEWQWTDMGHQGPFPTQALNSTTSGNGWMIVDSDLCGENQPAIENTSLISPVIDVSANSTVVLQFEQMFREYVADQCLIEFSNDGGDTWPGSIEINDEEEGTPNPDVVNVDATEWLAGESEARFRLHWIGDWDYGWQIDDVRLIDPPANDLEIIDNQYTAEKALFNDAEVSFQEYINGFQYEVLDQSQVRNTDFSATVRNIGEEDQTNVVLQATVTFPDGSTQMYSSEPLGTLPSFEDTLITIADTYIYADPAELGEYTVNMEVVQDETDGNPDNNIGNTITWEVSDETFAHAAGVYETSYQITQNAIFGVPLGVSAPLEVTHIGFVLANIEDASSTPGELIYLNIRKDVVFDEEDADGVGEADDGDSEGVDESELLYGPEELVYQIAEADLTTSQGEATWIWLELPEPMTLEEGFVYQPEIHLPPSGGDIATVAHSTNHTQYAGANFDYSELSGGPQGWWFLGTTCPLIRFATDVGVGLDDVDQITGVSLGQNFPNPAQELTTINYSVEKPMDLMLQVFDVNGRIIFAKDLGSTSSGEHRVDLNTKGWSTGRYSYSLVNAKGERLTRSMVIAR